MFVIELCGVIMFCVGVKNYFQVVGVWVGGVKFYMFNLKAWGSYMNKYNLYKIYKLMLNCWFESKLLLFELLNFKFKN